MTTSMVSERARASEGVRGLEAAALAATTAAAVSCQEWVGRGDPTRADAAATEAMRSALAEAPGLGTVVIGEGEKDAAPMLFNGEQVGNGDGPQFDVAVDPLECTKACAKGLPGSLTTIAIAAPGTLWSPGPAFYMDKLVVGAKGREAIDITSQPEDNAVAVAWSLGKSVTDLRAIVLDKPRHVELIGRLREIGVSVTSPADGDVAGALETLLPDGEADVLMGVGGTPEGVMTACAVRALGGGMEARLAPQRKDEARSLAMAGVDLDRGLDLEDLAAGESFFAATGVTNGSIARRPAQVDGAWRTDSILIAEGSVRRVLENARGQEPESGGPMSSDELELTAKALVAEEKGILAADESTQTIAKRLASVGVDSTIETRTEWRELLVTAPGASEAISGVILYDETFRQRRIPELVEHAGMLVGIKVDAGAKPLALASGEKVTEGLDGLRDRMGVYRERGARFTKWRGVIAIDGTRVPSAGCVAANAHALARFAALSQESGLVPVVEPEVLMEGDHSLERCFEVTEAVLGEVFEQLYEQRVRVEGMLLKTNMVLPGASSSEAGVGEVAEATVRCMLHCLPAELPGIVFLSGGQDEQLATAHLNAMNSLAPQPWELSFSFARALQASALSTWRGDSANRSAAQGAFLHRARCVSAARRGRYVEAMEKELVA